LARAGFTAFGWLPRRLRRVAIRWWGPSYTVGALCVVVDDGDLLLIRHTYRTGWSAPGGLLGRGERPERSAVREVREEVGLDVDLDGGPVPVVWPIFRRIDLAYRARLAPGARREDATVRSAELREVAWFPLDAVPVDDLDSATAEALLALGLTST
jgi:ADP-ribose pyrophosphatase YjhB (NUDIX family)